MLGNRRQGLGSRAVSLMLLVIAGGCSTATVPQGRAAREQGRIITAREIEATGASSAWDVLRRTNVPFASRDSRNAEPAPFSRGRAGGQHLSREPVLILNGIRAEGLDLLHHIRADGIASIRLLSGIDATLLYGTGAGGGAIVIEMKSGR